MPNKMWSSEVIKRDQLQLILKLIVDSLLCPDLLNDLHMWKDSHLWTLDTKIGSPIASAVSPYRTMTCDTCCVLTEILLMPLKGRSCSATLSHPLSSITLDKVVDSGSIMKCFVRPVLFFSTIDNNLLDPLNALRLRSVKTADRSIDYLISFNACVAWYTNKG